MRQRYALDASVLASIVNSDDVEHFSCYSFFRNLNDDDKALWVVPGLIVFEFQATQSKRYRKRRPRQPVFRHSPLHYENTELYAINRKFLDKVYKLDLYDKFSTLRGADLLYACIARVENIPLVTHDSDFDPYSKEVTLIKPRDLMRRTGKVTLQTGGKLYTVGYEEIKDGSGGTVRLDTGQATHVGGLTAKSVARLLLREIISSGLADKRGLGRPKQK
jgi:predicted nucleic acid-binding protein